MGKGDYSGGSTVIRAGSNWFSYRETKDQPSHNKKLARDTRPMSVQLAEAAEKLAAAKAEYDRGEWTAKKIPAKVKPTKTKKRKAKAK